ncbi:hypothetical protein COT97_04550 [Candidatus Falkowbacteria bacterium CG10_big_fil_rev_8_21_14_0_10_39_11]|uniref:Metallo-beta-lactamase domain-containing protein n=1 Tax=Candidatus Falkowbacteria bacterium CG10_big_fil_rev_8_21_14_0_10_39_11 TaxID=1974565 RepID=A0A2H0V5W5_9BACT|nr:MAG: hypothetical protein COT97_04550 [Candidatus Falkowbacteria bacterium CG10_big_fil_rev_8_21_14_0_10_39_11]
MYKHKRILFISLFIISVSISYWYFHNQIFFLLQNISPTVEGEKLLSVSFLDVGQGDSIYIKTPDQTDILIDGGPDNKVLSELGETMDFWDHQIDIMILTHPHADHIVGLIEVLKRYEVQSVYYTGVIYPSREYVIWLSLIEEQDIPLFVVTKEFELRLADKTELDFLYPNRDITHERFEEVNNSSIVTKLIYDQTSFLFTGDAEKEVEAELIERDINLQATVLKLGHHGSNSSSSEAFLQAVNPKLAIIQVGTNNSFGHPHLITLKRLERIGMPILRNDFEGTIKLESDGINIYRNYSN